MKSNTKSFTPDPQEIWESYRDVIYERRLSKLEEAELQITFYAGIETIYRLGDLLGPLLGKEQCSQALGNFRKEVQTASRQANLDRANGDS